MVLMVPQKNFGGLKYDDDDDDDDQIKPGGQSITSYSFTKSSHSCLSYMVY